MIISVSRRFIFVHLHKCGGESIEVSLAPHLTVNDVLNGAQAGTAEPWVSEMVLDRLIGLGKHAPAAAIKARLGDFYDCFYSFATVRTPHRRIHSLYSFCIGLVRRSQGLRAFLGADVVQTAPWPVLLGTLRGRLGLSAAQMETALATQQCPPRAAFLTAEGIFSYAAVQGALLSDSFAAFIRHDATRRDPAFVPQVSMISDAEGNPIVERVLRIEDIDRDWPEVAARLGVGPLLARHNASDYTGVPALTPDDARHLAEVFAMDYERFGYAPPG